MHGRRVRRKEEEEDRKLVDNGGRRKEGSPEEGKKQQCLPCYTPLLTNVRRYKRKITKPPSQAPLFPSHQNSIKRMCKRPLSHPHLSPDPHSSVLLETLDSTVPLLSLQSLRGDEEDGRRRYHGGGEGGRALLRPSWKEE